jgi:WD40 repeat protein
MHRNTFSLLAAIISSFCSISILTAQTPELILPIGHSAPVLDVAYSPDGKRIATSSNDRTVKIWDAESGRLMITIIDFSLMDFPDDISFSPDGKFILTVCNGYRISLWDSFTGKLLFEPSPARNPEKDSGEYFLNALLDIKKSGRFSPDGKLLLIMDNGINIWDVQSRKMMATVKGPKEDIKSFYVSPDSKYILTNSAKSSLDLWEISTGKFIRNFSSGIELSYISGSFTPDGKKIITRSEDEITLWDPQSGKMLLKLSTVSGSQHCISHDGSKILADGNLYLQKGRWVESSQLNMDSRSDLMGQIVGLYDAFTGKLTAAFVDSSTIKDNTYVGDYLALLNSAFSPDMKKVITVTDKCRIWDSEKGTLLFSIEGIFDNSTKAEYSPDGRRIFLASAAFCGIFDAVDGTLINSLDIPLFKTSEEAGLVSVYPAAGFSPDGKYLYIAPEFGNGVEIYDAFSAEMKTKLTGSIIPVFDPSFSRDGSTLVTKSITDKFEVRSWDFKNGKILQFFTDKDMGNAIYPCGGKVVHAFFFTMPDKVNIKTYDIQTGILLNNINLKANPFGNFIFSPDEKTFTVIDTSFNAKIYDAMTGSELHALPWSVGDVKYSPDGKMIVTTLYENFAKQCDVESGKLIREFKDQKVSDDGSMMKVPVLKGYDNSGKEILGDTIITRGIITADFSTDGKWLINTGGNWDNTTRIWNVENGRLINRFEGNTGAINNNGTKVITLVTLEDTIEFSTSMIPEVWNAIDGKLLFSLEPFELGSVSFSADGKNIITYNFSDSLKIWDAATGKLKKKITANGVLLNIDWQSDKIIFNENSQLTFYSIMTGEKLFSLLVMDSQDYLIVTPDNYYIGSDNAIKKLSWLVAGQLYPYEKYDLQYNRPDIVMERLGNTDIQLIKTYRDAYEKRLKAK